MAADALTTTRFVLITIGMIGNILSFLVFQRATFRNNSISMYCQALAITECHILWQFAVDFGLVFFNTYLPELHDLPCKLAFYVTFGVSTIPGWILVLFSVDKMLAMRKSQYPILKKKWFQLSLIAAIVLINLLLYLEIPILLTRTKYSRGFYCDLITVRIFNIILIVYLIQSGLVPFLIMIVTSLVMIVSIFRSRQRLERAGKIDRDRRSRDVKFAVSSIAFNLIFFLFKCPSVIMYMLIGNRIAVPEVFLYGSLFLFFANSCISIFVHLASNSLFRRELLIMLRLRKETRVEPSNSGSGGSNRTLSLKKATLHIDEK